jgi:hypothetical protein
MLIKWIAHVVRAWDLGSGSMASLVKCLNILSTCRKWVRTGWELCATKLRVAAPGSPPEYLRETG